MPRYVFCVCRKLHQELPPESEDNRLVILLQKQLQDRPSDA